MTKQLLEKVAKAKGINLEHFDKVAAFVNSKYTQVVISFWNHECVSHNPRRCNEVTVRLSVASILKREEEWPEDYETTDVVAGQWLWEFKK